MIVEYLSQILAEGDTNELLGAINNIAIIKDAGLSKKVFSKKLLNTKFLLKIYQNANFFNIQNYFYYNYQNLKKSMYNRKQ